MTKTRTLAAAVSALASVPAWAGPAVPLGVPTALGVTALGGVSLGAFLPVTGGAVIVVAAVALVAGARIARRKRGKRD